MSKEHTDSVTGGGHEQQANPKGDTPHGRSSLDDRSNSRRYAMLAGGVTGFGSLLALGLLSSTLDAESISVLVVPTALLFGAVVASYLRGGDRREGVIVGSGAALLAVLPLLVPAILLFGTVISTLLQGGAISFGGSMTADFFVLPVASVLTIVLAGTLGGLSGTWLTDCRTRER